MITFELWNKRCNFGKLVSATEGLAASQYLDFSLIMTLVNVIFFLRLYNEMCQHMFCK